MLLVHNDDYMPYCFLVLNHTFVMNLGIPNKIENSNTLVTSRRFEFDGRYPHDLRFFFFWPKFSYKENLIAVNKGFPHSKE